LAALGFLHKIVSLFSPPKKAADLTQAQIGNCQALQADKGAFEYEDDGFRYPFKEYNEKIAWVDIERITGYKKDLMTTDEICMDDFEGEWKVTFSASLPGWYYLLTKLKSAFPAIPDDWDGQVMWPAFATNFTVLYERGDRVMPESTNFYAWLNTTSSEATTKVFEENGWAARKSADNIGNCSTPGQSCTWNPMAKVCC
jgi:hypothetical protein